MARATTDLFGSERVPTIAIVGAGFSGIGLSVLLKRAGINTFVVYEAGERVGGAWWHNHYPGAEVDTLSYIYSFPFRPYGWSRTHARRDELQQYLESTVAEFGIGPHLRLGTQVLSAVWDEDRHLYDLELDTGERAQSNLLVAATGFLNVPKYPSLDGLDTFQGPQFHSARWEHDHDLSNRLVGVIGTGSTATQLVPELAKIAKKVYLFQREPGWVIPKGERPYSQVERRRLASRWRYRLARARWFAGKERLQWRGGPWRPGSVQNDAGRRAALAFIESELGDRPDLMKAVTPDYPFWGKRLIFNSTFYASLKEPNVELIPRAAASITPAGIVDIDGVHRDVDVLVLATGFRTTDYVGTMEVRGSDGRTLKESWSGEPQAFLGITVPNFPNFFMLYGPGTNGGEIVSMLLREAEYVVRVAKRMSRSAISAVEVKPAWSKLYNSWLETRVDQTSWAVADNYYKGATGKIVTQWPFGPLLYGLLVRLLGGPSEIRRRRTGREEGHG
jgi:cation diffusion facilitator CzcD-associated flavoprotein CzcO